MKRAKRRSIFLFAAIAIRSGECHIRASRNRAAASIGAGLTQRDRTRLVAGTPEGFRNRTAGRETRPGNARGRRAASFQFPAAATKTLPNGLRVFVVTDHSKPAVAARLVILSAGSIQDPAGMPGVAEMTAGLLTQGTAKRSAKEIAEAIDFIGGTAGGESRARRHHCHARRREKRFGRGNGSDV